MLTRTDIAPLSIAAATATAAGLLFGVWAAPPASLREASYRSAAQPILADDPNLARYKQVIAEQGGAGPLYMVTGYSAPEMAASAPVEPDPGAVLEAQLAREQSAFERQAQVWQAEREAWLEQRRAEQQPVHPLPVAYAEAAPPAPAAHGAEAETGTTAQADDPR